MSVITVLYCTVQYNTVQYIYVPCVCGLCPTPHLQTATCTSYTATVHYSKVQYRNISVHTFLFVLKYGNFCLTEICLTSKNHFFHCTVWKVLYESKYLQLNLQSVNIFD